MRYFVTGGTGFIGSALIRQLRGGGHEVVALVRDPSKAEGLRAPGVELVEGDVTRRETLRASMEGADGVFHVAGWYKIGMNGTRAEAVNVEGTRNVLETMRTLGIPKGVYTSTLAINSHTDGRCVDENHRYHGPHLSIYDETKWRAHHEVATQHIEQGLPLVIVMPGAVYGPGDTSQLGIHLQEALAGKLVLLPGGGTGVCWSYIDDVVRGHILAMERGVPGEAYIISGPCHTFREGFGTAARIAGRKLRAVWMPPRLLKITSKLTALVEKVLPVPPTYSSEAMRVTAGTTYYGDNSKAKRDLGFSPRSLEEGMREVVPSVLAE